MLHMAAEAQHVPAGARGPEGPERALPEHMRTLQALLPRPERLRHAPVPLGFIVEVRRLLCRAIPAREALRTYHLSAGNLDRLPIYKVCSWAHCSPDASFRPCCLTWPDQAWAAADLLD